MIIDISFNWKKKQKFLISTFFYTCVGVAVQGKPGLNGLPGENGQIGRTGPKGTKGEPGLAQFR